jgi:flavin-dependent dehydrogenase
MRYRTPYAGAVRTAAGFDLGPLGTTRYLVGADGPNSSVAASLGLGRNRRFLFGVEYEFAGAALAEPSRLHCFIDRRLAPGYIGWLLAGVGGVQVGLARRVAAERVPAADALAAFVDRIAPIADFRQRTPTSIRAGHIPCGGLVRPVAAPRVLLCGDAAGMVSPVTAGGIHTALKHGLAAGAAIADFLAGRGDDPARGFVARYPRFRGKRVLRFLYDHLQSDVAFNLLLATRPMRAAAGLVYFHHKGVFGTAAPARRADGGETGAGTGR